MQSNYSVHDLKIGNTLPSAETTMSKTNNPRSLDRASEARVLAQISIAIADSRYLPMRDLSKLSGIISPILSKAHLLQKPMRLLRLDAGGGVDVDFAGALRTRPIGKDAHQSDGDFAA